ncbi:branched-chain amino acid ABC transporter permease [Chloroflexus sp.]|uniref:branched-chain amino acid ABC transporter permease n=2 Tax=Chloroflexus TaxID=1107 RepID=UPI0026134258|nr:branched-chain amino acid ABC transporter permease [uncultured Chloroflexus sp.]
MIELIQRRRGLIAGIIAIILFGMWASTQYEPRVLASILLSGLTLGALYFLVTSGLSLIFGLMDVLNFAHGTLFMIGAYIGFTLYANPRLLLNTLPFGLALVAGWILARWLPANSLPSGHRRPLWVAAVLVGLFAIWNFELAPLATTALSSGGRVPTEQAQAPTPIFIARALGLAVAGVIAGAAFLAGREHTRRPERRDLIVPIILLALALLIAPLRLTLEEWLLSLDSNTRFLLALLIGAGGGAALGGLMEWSLIRPLYSRPIYQVLVTLGLVFVGTELVKGVWGPGGYFMELPAWFSQRGPNCPSPNLIAWLQDNCASIDVLGRPFPSYRIFIIALGILMFVGIAVLLRYTRLGMIIRAGVQDGEMVQALGINVRRVFTLVFALGAGLAALGGVAAAPFLGISPGLGQEFQLQAFIAVVIGGMGSFTGAAIGSLLVGLARAFGDQIVLTGIQLPWMSEAMTFSPSIARASTVLIMALVLLLRPAGLFGKKE